MDEEKNSVELMFLNIRGGKIKCQMLISLRKFKVFKLTFNFSYSVMVCIVSLCFILFSSASNGLGYNFGH